jgi:hypothetical protein
MGLLWNGRRGRDWPWIELTWIGVARTGQAGAATKRERQRIGRQGNARTALFPAWIALDKEGNGTAGRLWTGTDVN